MELAEGQKAPEFSLPSADGRDVALADFRGKTVVVLYFYPKDDTPGCTTEACEFRDAAGSFKAQDAVVIGVSPDGPGRHRKFIEKHRLPFLLLSDEKKDVCQRYGVWVKKSMYGRTYMGVARTTFVIDKKGRIVRIFKNVKPRGHSREVADVLASS